MTARGRAADFRVSSNEHRLSVIGLLVFRSSWGKNDLETFDFTLPGDVTNYVVSVQFDEAGEIDGIDMES